MSIGRERVAWIVTMGVGRGLLVLANGVRMRVRGLTVAVTISDCGTGMEGESISNYLSVVVYLRGILTVSLVEVVMGSSRGIDTT